MKLYSGPLSLFTAKVRIALDEKDLPYERVDVTWSPERRYEPHHPDVVALNPKKQVPVLVDGDTAVSDSTLIFEYLEDRYPDPPLYPADAAGRAEARQLEAHADEMLFPWVWDLIEEVFYPPPPEGRATARRDAAVRAIAARHHALDTQLADRAFLCGDAFGYADIATFVFLHAAALLGAPIGTGTPRDEVDTAPGAAPLASLRAWSTRVAGRPAVAREIEAQGRVVASLALRPAS